MDECKMRDIFKEQPKNRDDLDLSHIKKGDYVKRQKNIDEESDMKMSIIMPISEMGLMENSVKVKEKPTNHKISTFVSNSMVESIKKPLTLEVGLQST